MTWDPSQHPRVPAGQSGGGRWGAARNAKAAEAQKNTSARSTADQVVGMNTSERGALLKKLSDDQLKALTEFLYASATSDPDIVKARIAVANEMSRRGFDVKDYGALGGGGGHGPGARAAHAAAGPHPRNLSRATALRQAAARQAAATARRRGPGKRAV